MTLGEAVDLCIEHHNTNFAQTSSGKKKEGRHMATQAEIDAYFG